MKIIEAIIMRSDLADFSRCVRQLGIFGFDLSEERANLGDRQRLADAGKHSFNTTARMKVDFAVLDEETKQTIHAVLESVHPDSIAIFKFDNAPPQASATQQPSIQP
jgi:hypothetical protein